MYTVRFPMNILAFDIYDHAKRNGATTERVTFSSPGKDPLVNRMQRVVYFSGNKVDFTYLKSHINKWKFD